LQKNIVTFSGRFLKPSDTIRPDSTNFSKAAWEVYRLWSGWWRHIRWRHANITWPPPVCVRCRRAAHHPSSSRPEGRRQRHRDVHLPGDRQSIPGRVLPAVGRPAYHHPSPPRPLLSASDPARRRSARQPGQCAPRRRAHRLRRRERSRRPGHRLRHPASLRRGTRYAYQSPASYTYRWQNVT